MEILGVKIDSVTYQEALEKAKKILDSEGKYYIVTPNPELLVRAHKDPEFKKILNSADLSLPDGVGLVALSGLGGEKLPERVTGVDFLDGLAALAENLGFSLYLLGGEQNVAKKAAEELRKRYPKLNIVGASSGNPDPKFDSVTRKPLTRKKIDILAVAYGSPKQEKWIARNLHLLNVKVAIGVGGAFDFISGKTRRAPVWMRKASLEWLFRLLNEPRRVKRQLALPYFIYLVIREKLKQS